MKKFVTYLRVSTKKQGASGLGLEAQEKICADFIAANNGECVATFKDVESGTSRERVGLANAVAYCKANGCALVVAKLDRLARDVEFCFRIVNTGIEIHFCDMPQVNTLLLGVFAAVAQYERELTSDRTKKALAAKKVRGEKIGAASDRWQASFKAKTKERKEKEAMERGRMKNERYVQSKDVQAFLKILKRVFPDACENEDPRMWDWSSINTKGDAKERIESLMIDFRTIDHELFSRFDFSSWDATKKQIRISAQILNVRKAINH